MRYRLLGTTGVEVSVVALGAGPVAGVMTGDDPAAAQALVGKAVAVGINWFDTAAGYGQGKSELHLGQALAGLRTDRPVHVATKVRLRPNGDEDMRPLVLASIRESLSRLRRERATLVQLHNAITVRRGEQPDSLSVDDVLRPRGAAEGLEEARAAGLCDHIGLTGTGDAASLVAALESRRFATIQAPAHLLDPTGLDGPLGRAAALGLGGFAIRVFAAGALLGAEPSAHTHTTPYFPLPLYREDQAKAARLAERLGGWNALRETALRWALSQPAITGAIVGFGAPEQIEEAARVAALAPFSAGEIANHRRQIASL